MFVYIYTYIYTCKMPPFILIAQSKILTERYLLCWFVKTQSACLKIKRFYIFLTKYDVEHSVELRSLLLM